FITHPTSTECYTLSLHDALPILAVSLGLGALLQASELAYTGVKVVGATYLVWLGVRLILRPRTAIDHGATGAGVRGGRDAFWRGDRKSTRLNSSHVKISYAVLCL